MIGNGFLLMTMHTVCSRVIGVGAENNNETANFHSNPALRLGRQDNVNHILTVCLLVS